MVDPWQAVQVLFPAAAPLIDYAIAPDGTLTKWNAAKLGPQPTAAQLAAVTDAQVAAGRLQKARAEALRLLQLTDPSDPLAGVVWAVRAGLYQIQDGLNDLRPAGGKKDRQTGKVEIATKVQSGEADS